MPTAVRTPHPRDEGIGTSLAWSEPVDGPILEDRERTAGRRGLRVSTAPTLRGAGAGPLGGRRHPAIHATRADTVATDSTVESRMARDVTAASRP